MRLWSLHPSYLDTKGLVAVWREALLARAVLANQTKGYKRHSQLLRFQCLNQPLVYINHYLDSIYKEACNRGYKFDAQKLEKGDPVSPLTVTTKQLQFEANHLYKKLLQRDKTGQFIQQLTNPAELKPHSLFIPIAGDIEYYERITEQEILCL